CSCLRFCSLTTCCLVVLGFFGGIIAGQAQDVGWIVESSPLVSMILVKSLEKCSSFSAGVDVNISGKADPVPSSATGSLAFRGGSCRWDVKLGDIKSAQLTSNAKAVIRQINGDQFLLLTRPEEHANYLVLAQAQAYLEQPLPSLKLTSKG